MAKTKSTKGNQNRDDDDDDDASSMKRIKICDKGVVAHWSELNHDVLCLVMMQLGVVDFVAFSGVCKSWRSLALCNKNMFMASRPPMSICIYTDTDTDGDEKVYHYLEEFEGRKLKAIIPHPDGRNCVGFTCGYVVYYGEEAHDFWLVNPITRHGLHFPNFPSLADEYLVKALLVLSPSILGWVFVVAQKYSHNLWFSTSGEGAWNYVSSTSPIIELHFFKGKIYTMNLHCHLCQLRLVPKPELTLLEINKSWKPYFGFPEFASSGENLYAVKSITKDWYEVQVLDFGKMEWVLVEEKAIEEYAFFLGGKEHGGVVIKPESWSQYKRYDWFPDAISRTRSFFSTNMWYFPHLSLDVDIIDE